MTALAYDGRGVVQRVSIRSQDGSAVLIDPAGAVVPPGAVTILTRANPTADERAAYRSARQAGYLLEAP